MIPNRRTISILPPDNLSIFEIGIKVPLCDRVKENFLVFVSVGMPDSNGPYLFVYCCCICLRRQLHKCPDRIISPGIIILI